MVTISMSKIGQSFKTSTTVHIAEYCQELDSNTICINLDTLHKTFDGYEKLNVHNEFIDNGFANFNKLINFIIENKDSNIVINCGVCLFNSLAEYIAEHNIFSFFQSKNIDLFLVSIIEGGVNTYECIQDFNILSKIPHANLIVIDDERMGTTRIEDKEFFETKAYINAVASGVIYGEMHFPKFNEQRKPYLLQMLRRKLQFCEVEDDVYFKSLLYMSHFDEIRGFKRNLWDNFNQVFSKDNNKKITLEKARVHNVPLAPWEKDDDESIPENKSEWFMMIKCLDGDIVELPR